MLIVLHLILGGSIIASGFFALHQLNRDFHSEGTPCKEESNV